MSMITHYIDVGSYQDGGFVLRARVLFDGTSVEIKGPDHQIVDELRRGVAGPGLETFTPSDGLAFLYAVRDAFRTPNLLATEIRTGAPTDTLKD